MAPVVRNAIAQGLRMGGRALGTFVGGPAGGTFGEGAGAWVSKLIGSGDYEVKSNSIYSKGHAGVPTFANSGRTVRIQHREYLGDITGSTAFSNRSYALNPGSSNTFPWLAAVASNYQQYKFHGLVFCFNSMSADALNSVNTALGTVIMATQYNVNRDDFASKLEMEGYEFSCSTRPSQCLMHPVECAVGETPIEQMYIRSGEVPSGEDRRLYDHGNFQVATTGMQAAANIGELWVTYDVELYKPRVPPGGSVAGQFTRIENGPYTNTDVLGSIQTVPKGNLGITVVSNGTYYNRIFFPSNLTTGKFFVSVYWYATGSTAMTMTQPTLTNLTYVTDFHLSQDGYLFSPGNATAIRQSYIAYVTINGYSAAGSYIEFPSETLATSPASVDVFVVSIPSSDVFV
jgi:hypothetical protein